MMQEDEPGGYMVGIGGGSQNDKGDGGEKKDPFGKDALISDLKVV